MTYPITTTKLDAWTRGKIEMFARVVEIQNQHPSWIDDAVINELYQEVKDHCKLRETRAVMVDDINIVEEKE